MGEAGLYIFDDERFKLFTEIMISKRAWVTLRDHDVSEMEQYLRGIVQTGARSKPVYVYSNTDNKSRFTMPRQKTETVSFARLEGEAHGNLSIAKLTQGQMNTLRSEYLSLGIIPSSAALNIGVLVGGKLIGALAFSRSQYDWVDVYMMSDFAIRPTIYKRLSKLVLVAALSKELQEVLKQSMNMKVQTIGTTAFTENAVSMKYRGIFELHSRKDGRLNYSAPAGRWSLQEGFEWWKQKHGQTLID